MDFFLPKEHELFQKMCRDFAEKELRPIAADIDEEERFPVETLEKMKRYGFMSIPIPKEYGGQGFDNLAYVISVEELAKVCLATTTIYTAHISLCCNPLLLFGTEEQKQKYLIPLSKGEYLGAFGLTEPMAGTDASMQQTIAVLKGDNYILNGSKIFITNSAHADVFIIIAMTDKSKGTKGCSAFIVEKTFPGFRIGKREKKMGIRASDACEVIMEDCVVPKENLLGKEGQGFRIAMESLDTGRIGIAAQALGLAEGALNETVKYVKERKQFGKRISQFQNTQFELADMRTKIEAAQLLVYKVARMKDTHQNFTANAAMAKLYCSELASDVTRRCLQLFGGYGYTREYPIERMMRDAKITEIYEGTSEVQKMVISSWMKVN
ncbi:MAG: acyl-CoA dehydrogenase [Lachnospiraceae bacterium]|nr:acyl-CoA dehydrogenase [Lachnospiraceae bacterium]